jgi:hypothetical protein
MSNKNTLCSKSYEIIQKKRNKKPLTSLNKCLQLTARNLFSCKSNKNRNDYEYFNYESGSTTTSFSSSYSFNHDSPMLRFEPIQPATSTMIDRENNSSSDYSTYSMFRRNRLSSNTRNDQTNEFSLNCDKQKLFNTADSLTDDEETCKSSYYDYQTQSISQDYDNIANFKHNTSPISTNYCEDTYTVNMQPICMHSTKMSNTNRAHYCFDCQMSQNLSPMGHKIRYNSSILASPVSTSTSLETYNSYQNSYTSPFKQEIHRQLQAFESIISTLSQTVLNNDSIENVNETHVCAQNYEATFVDDVTVHFADTIKILKDQNNEWLYVKVATDGRQGYVPKAIVMDLRQFVEQLVKTKQSLIQNLIN